MSRLMHDDSSAYSVSSTESESTHFATSSDTNTSAKTKDRRYKNAEHKFERAATKKKMEKAEGRTKRRAEHKIREEKQSMPINKDYQYCKRSERRTRHPNYPEEECFFNKKYKG